MRSRPASTDQPTTGSDLIAQRIMIREPDRSPGTTKGARHRLRTHHRRADLPPVQKLRPQHIDSWYSDLRAQGLAPASVLKLHADLHAALNLAVRWDLLMANPADRVDVPKVPRSDITVPTNGQVRELIAAAPDDLAVWLRVAATTGHRAGTLAASRWSDIDLEEGSVVFSRAIIRGSDGLVEKGTKANRADAVTLDGGTARALAEHRTRMAERALATGVGLSDDAFVWSADPACQRPRDPNSVGRQFLRLRRSLGLPDGITLHALRHYAASKMLAAGIGSAVVADRLGATTRVIESTYRHHMPGQDQVAADLMGEALGG
jgi:integrase